MAAGVVLPPAPPTLEKPKQMPHNHTCPSCGSHLPRASDGEALKIAELEAQVEMLKEKATAAVDKCADYEDQLRSVKASQIALPRSNTSDSLTPSNGRPSNEEPRPSTANSAAAKVSRFSSLLSGRRGAGSPGPSQTPTASPPTDADLKAQLEKERLLREKAEAQAQKLSTEIEDLSVQLFSQANEMVADERKARAKLEARVEQLEKKDKDKMARLERLEKAVTRIDRVKALLASPNQGVPAPAPLRRP